MARAYYPSESGYAPWTADMVNGFSLDGRNHFISLSHNTTNELGYRCVLNETITSAWDHRHCSYAVVSRHSGTGILSFEISSSYTTDINSNVSLNFCGATSNMLEDAWTAVVNENNVKLYAKMYDYNSVYLACLQNIGFELMTDGSWATELPSGTQYPVNINNSEIAVQSSRPTNPNAKIWIKI